MKQSDLAKTLEVSVSTVSAWERGTRKPDFSVFEELADIFSVSLAYLIGQTADRTPPAIPTNEELAQWAFEDEIVQLETMVARFAQLSREGQEIVLSTLNAVSKVERRRGLLGELVQYQVMMRGRPEPE